MAFNESKIKRDGDGKFATQGGSTPAEEKRAAELLGVSRKELVLTLKAVADKRDGSESKQIVSVNLDTDLQKKLNGATPNEQRRIVFDYIMENMRGKYPAQDGREIIISRKSADKYVQNATEIKLRTAPELGDMIAAGNLVNIVNADHKTFKQFAYYSVSFEVGDRIYDGLLNVGIHENGVAALYDLNPFNPRK